MKNKASLVILLVSSLFQLQCEEIGRQFLKNYNKKYETDNKVLSTKPAFLGKDTQRKQIQISLSEVTQCKEPTDIQFFPGESSYLFLLEKSGNLLLFDRKTKKQRKVHSWGVLTDSEEGLLGLAFSPQFSKNGIVYINYVRDKNGRDFTTISEVQLKDFENFDSLKVVSERVLLEIEQPYPNHNAGQLAFGKDNLLYIGLGDGGLRADPKKHGQNTLTLLGSILRIDPKPEGEKPYSIPQDNPFVGKKDYLPEIFAYGIRNPWRFSFTPKGDLLLADVGQDAYEEINRIEAGKNYGWSPMEGFHCFESGCESSKYAPPIYEYSHEEGQSITGGYSYSGSDLPALQGKYVFGDFITGKIWAIDLPQGGGSVSPESVYALGKWNVLISTFGRDASGEIFFADYQSGKIFKIVASSSK